MSKRFDSLKDRRYMSGMDFGYALKEEGFDNESDNGRVMASLWDKVEEVNKLAGERPSSNAYFIDAALQPNPVHECDLILTLRSRKNEDISGMLVLFLRNNSLTVSSNVITDEFRKLPSDLPVPGITLYWFEAEQMFKAQTRFDRKALSVFRAVYKTIARGKDEVTCRLHMQPTQQGWQVEYRIHSEKVFAMHYDFNK